MSQKFNTIYISELNSQKFRVVNNWGGVMSRSKYKKFIEVKKDAPIYAKRIAIIMNEKGWSQKDLSERCNGKISVSEGTITGWLQGSNGKYTEPRINALNEVAKVLEVSLDFLLGNSDVKSPDTTLQAIGKMTGLSESAIEKLISWKDTEGRYLWGEFISAILEDEDIESILGKIGEVVSYSRLERKAFDNNDSAMAIDMIDMQMARLWYISKSFTDIVENMSLRVRTGGDS